MFSEFKPILKEKGFVYLWTSQIFSQLTVNMMNFLLLFRLFALTGSSIATSLLWVFYALPAILVGPFGSATADFVNRKKILAGAVLAQSLIIFSYSLIPNQKVFLLYGVVVAYSFFNQFYVPAEASSLATLVPKQALPSANSLFFLTQQAALVVGFALASLLRGLVGFSVALYVCAFFLVVAFVSANFLPDIRPKNLVPKEFEDAVGGFFKSIVDGYRYIKGNQKVQAPYLLLGGAQVALAIVLVNIPVFATEILRMDVQTAGFLVVIPAALGGLIGALLATKLLSVGWSKKRIIELALMVLTFSIFMLVFAVHLIAGLPGNILGVFLLALAGCAFVGMIVSAQTYLQEVTPEDLRGRVFGNFWFLVTVATIFPVIFSGTITEIFGIKMLLTVLGALVFGLLLYSKKINKGFFSQEI